MTSKLPIWLNPDPWLKYSQSTDLTEIKKAILSDHPGEKELALMLSPNVMPLLELMAQKAENITRRHFGRTIALYSPLYLSNYCNGGCLYCGIAADRRAERSVLNYEELDKELEMLSSSGIDEIVLLTGERMPEADTSYIREAIKRSAKKFNTINIEVFPMQEKEYRSLSEAGCTGVTIYQETYDESIYEKMHRWGDKRDFTSRLDAPNRALNGGFRTIGLGVLLGLSNPTYDLIALYRHAHHLLKNYWQAGVTISFPRIKPQMGDFKALYPVDEKMLAQAIFAMRICLPNVPLLLSTRESESIRDGLAGLGISKMSVASKTTVGGYSKSVKDSTEQFSISDERSVSEFCHILRLKGFEPVFKNYDAIYREPAVYKSSNESLCKN